MSEQKEGPGFMELANAMLSGNDIDGDTVVVIEKVTVEKVPVWMKKGQFEMRGILHLRKWGKWKPSKTALHNIMLCHGNDAYKWAGKTITIYPQAKIRGRQLQDPMINVRVEETK